ncbi:MAG: TIGR00282 family metallophosphoesterase [Acidobacteriota bacterium]
MNILFIGDIIGRPGRRMLDRHLDGIVDRERIDFVVANAENAAGGFGLTPEVAEELLGMGIHCLTSGNHIWDKREIFDYLTRHPSVLRPLNYAAGCPGSGVFVGETAGGEPVAVLNVMGRVFMPPVDDPFRRVDEEMRDLDGHTRVVVVDIHAETTSEKIAMGWFLAGRASLVAGTHTHVPTADARILDGVTAYQSDVGMTGPYDSVIGVQKEDILQRFTTGMPVRFRTAKRGVELHATVAAVDSATGHATGIRTIHLGEDD